MCNLARRNPTVFFCNLSWDSPQLLLGKKEYFSVPCTVTQLTSFTMDGKKSSYTITELTNAVSMASIASENNCTDEFMDDSMIYPELLDPTVLQSLDSHMSNVSLMGSLTSSQLIQANPLSNSLSSMVDPLWGSTPLPSISKNGQDSPVESEKDAKQPKHDQHFIDDLLLASSTSPRRSRPVEIMDPMFGPHSAIATDAFIKDSPPPHSWVDGQCVSSAGKVKSSSVRVKHRSVDETGPKRTQSPGTGHHLMQDFVHYFRRFSHGHHKESSDCSSASPPPNKTRIRHQSASTGPVESHTRARAHSTGSSIAWAKRPSKAAAPPVEISCQAVYKIYDSIVKEGMMLTNVSPSR